MMKTSSNNLPASSFLQLFLALVFLAHVVGVDSVSELAEECSGIDRD
jgi:hypothetical protein